MKKNTNILKVLTENGFVLETKNGHMERYKLKLHDNIDIICELTKDDITLICDANGCSLIDSIFLDDYNENICPSCFLEKKLLFLP